MDAFAWEAEARRRIGISEGCESRMYHDSLGIPTIGIGFNLTRSDARTALQHAGVSTYEIGDVIAGNKPLTSTQVARLFDYSFAPIMSEARSSLAPGVYDQLSDARRFVVCDLTFNLGAEGWNAFTNTRALINSAQHFKNEGDGDQAALIFAEAADHLMQSDWYTQVGSRAKRNVAMMRKSVWCDPYGDGSDIR